MVDLPPQRNELDKLRAAVTSQLQNASTPEAIETAGRTLAQVIEIEKQIAETEKARSEKQKLEWDMQADTRRARSEERRNLVTLLAPLLTTIVLAGTLTLQTYQAITSERDKQVDQERQRDAAEDIRWADTLKVLSGEISGISPGSLGLVTFFASRRYNELARQTAQTVLFQTKDFQQFKQLLAAAFGNLSWRNLNEFLLIGRRLSARTQELSVKAYAPGAVLTPDETAAYSFWTDSVEYMCGQVAQVLRSPRPPGVQLDMSYLSLTNCDMSQADFSNANLSGFNPTGIDFNGANFSGATGYETGSWTQNAWWRALNIDKGMLSYLVKNAPYDPKANYGTLTVSQKDYDDNIRRLSK